MVEESKTTLEGICYLWAETGTEGSYWAFMDKNCEGYKGLYVLEDGDHLTIYDKKRPTKIEWSGIIKLRKHPLFTEDAFGLWIHSDQEGINRKKWANYFLEEYPAKLVTSQKKDRA